MIGKRNVLTAVVLASLAYAGAAFAASSGVIADRVPLRDAPNSDAATIANLEAQTRVVILQRKGAWLQVEIGSQRGWVRLLSVRTAVSDTAGDSGLGKVFAVATGQSTGSSVTTGVRGLDKESIRNAAPNPAELSKLDAWVVTAVDAGTFAQTAPALRAQTMTYVGANGESQ